MTCKLSDRRQSLVQRKSHMQIEGLGEKPFQYQDSYAGILRVGAVPGASFVCKPGVLGWGLAGRPPTVARLQLVHAGCQAGHLLASLGEHNQKLLTPRDPNSDFAYVLIVSRPRQSRSRLNLPVKAPGPWESMPSALSAHPCLPHPGRSVALAPSPYHDTALAVSSAARNPVPLGTLAWLRLAQSQRGSLLLSGLTPGPSPPPAPPQPASPTQGHPMHCHRGRPLLSVCDPRLHAPHPPTPARPPPPSIRRGVSHHHLPLQVSEACAGGLLKHFIDSQ